MSLSKSIFYTLLNDLFQIISALEIHTFEKVFTAKYIMKLERKEQNPSSFHGMAEVGRNLWRSSATTSLLKQGHLEQTAITIAGCNYLTIKIQTKQTNKKHKKQPKNQSHPQTKAILKLYKVRILLFAFFCTKNNIFHFVCAEFVYSNFLL